ncbi:MAG: hypothetical protein PVI01_05545 [Gemmatimonadales bacterium]|jgi:hypothetical protein
MKLSRIALPLLFVAAVRPAVAQPTTSAALTLRIPHSPSYYSTLDWNGGGTVADSSPAAFMPLPKYGGWVSVTKWVTLAASIGLGAAGAVWHHDANDIFTRLDTLCKADPDNCRDRNSDGSYADPVLEDMYQTVLEKDGRARTAFVGAQVSFGVSVLLFIVDFQRDDGPGNIPYDPDEGQSPLRFTAKPGELAVRYYFD